MLCKTTLSLMVVTSMHTQPSQIELPSQNTREEREKKLCQES